MSQRRRPGESGSVCLTPITHPPYFQILEMNAKSGNSRQTLSLLNLQKARDYTPLDISDTS